MGMEHKGKRSESAVYMGVTYGTSLDDVTDSIRRGKRAAYVTDLLLIVGTPPQLVSLSNSKHAELSHESDSRP